GYFVTYSKAPTFGVISCRREACGGRPGLLSLPDRYLTPAILRPSEHGVHQEDYPKTKKRELSAGSGRLPSVSDGLEHHFLSFLWSL
ncbi:MAG: hypothetical protein KAY37_14490, partial [Phycisphaerae bacterium]|nr:hypothetical protein [Phycisphaerae bacterium]